ncbi:uncharacterized protein LOC116341207 [Contarinia nasturtii]|uniref:uncharacterized protein LOC116341207 n=1 Tax=Contarinia nasturtii TaxID=265458 RepID=UPI0012D3C0BC|nr:uncharacterized protein LOC116341207 [Contarinia nasturtii]
MNHSIQVLVLVAFFTNGVQLAFGDNSKMFDETFSDGVKDIEERIQKLKNTLQTVLDKHRNNEDLLFIKEDIERFFVTRTLTSLKQVHEMYIQCSQRFEPIYTEYLRKVSTIKNAKEKSEKKSKFQAIVKSSRGKVLMTFKIGIYLRYIQDKLIQLEDKHSIFSTILNLVKVGESGDDKLDEWMIAIRPAIDIESNLKEILKNASCQEINDFIDALKETFTS